MTKLVAICCLFVVALLITAGAYAYTASMKQRAQNTRDINTLTTRKEDLLATQQRIEQQLAMLDANVQQAVAEQQKLSASVSATTNTPLPTVTPVAPKPTSTPPAPAPITAPTPAPAPTPTTRAS